MRGKDLRDTVGLVLVVGGLLFVGLELRQTNAIARGETRRALADRSIDLIMSRAMDTELASQVSELLNTEEEFVDCSALSKGCSYVTALLRHHEDVFIQVREGVADESVFASYGFRTSTLYEREWFREQWPGRRENLDPGFVLALEAAYGLPR